LEAFFPAGQYSPFAGDADEAEALEEIIQEAVLWKPDETSRWRGAQPAPDNDGRAMFGNEKKRRLEETKRMRDAGVVHRDQSSLLRRQHIRNVSEAAQEKSVKVSGSLSWCT